MRSLIAAIILLSTSTAFAQQAPSPQPQQAIPPDVLSLETQLSEVGCNAERVTAAQEIYRLRQQVAALQKDQADPSKKVAKK